MLDSRSAIAGLLARGGRDGADGRRRLRLGECCGWYLVQLGHYADTAAQFAAAVQGAIGDALPTSATEAALCGSDVVMRVAPDQYWFLTGDAGRAGSLASAVPIEVGTALPLSASRTRIVMDGAESRAVLMKLVPIDLHPSAFAIRCFAQTGIHHVGGLLYRAGVDRYEYFALRTYAATTWEAIADAALPLGYETFVDGGPA